MFGQLGYFICIPFAALTRLFYTWTGSYGFALILFTLVIKVVLLPFQLKSKKSMLRMNRMSGKVKEIQTRYANNRERQQQEISELYAREGINPMGGCLWSLIPFPILIALYNVIRYPLRYFMTMPQETVDKITQLATSLGYKAPEGAKAVYAQINLAEFIHQNWASFEGKFDRLIDLDYRFLGMDLSAIAKDGFSQFPGGGWAVWGLLLLPIIAAAIQFFMSMRSAKNSSGAEAGSMKTMMYMMPLMTLWFGFSLPSALCVYWIAQSAFSVVQEQTLNKYFNKILDREETDKERAKREARYAKYEKQKEMMAQQQAQSGKSTSTSKKKQQQYKATEKKQAGTNENGRLGNRPYARGRAYSEDHYAD